MKKIALPLIILLLAFETFFLSYLWIHRQRCAWVDISKVYGEFEYKKELQGKLEQVQNTRKFILDSMEFELKDLQQRISLDKKPNSSLIQIFEQKRDRYMSQEQIFQEDNKMMIKKYDEQIVNQLNQYVKDYGEKHHFTYIYGADGSGFLMYANKGDDITEELKVYVNERYRGKAE